MESRLLLNIVVTQSASIIQLFSGENQTLLVWGNSFLVLNLLFDVFNAIARFYFETTTKPIYFREIASFYPWLARTFRCKT
jgi:magnesium-transporting ATPase (P-type)